MLYLKFIQELQLFLEQYKRISAQGFYSGIDFITKSYLQGKAS